MSPEPNYVPYFKQQVSQLEPSPNLAELSPEEIGLQFDRIDALRREAEAKLDAFVKSHVEVFLQNPKLADLISVSGLTEEQVLQGCKSLFTHSGIICRDQLELRERRRTRVLEVDWGNPEGNAHWVNAEGGAATEPFTILNATRFCSKHVAGFDETLGFALAEEFVQSMREGKLNLMSLVEFERSGSTVRYMWES